MVLSTPNFGIQSYVDWYNSITEKNSLNQELYTRQDFSIMGIVRRIVGKANISNLYFIIPGFILFLLPYVRIKQYKHISYQLMILASTLLFVVLFSSSSENPNYIIAVAGVMI